mmetsp:Transcript_43758/g.115730  ORF Transcript_43758/g.115730 Transcript_43758/m.115730 type:complete len:791 (-) Transcript_43758:163-2535(-)
MLARVHGGGADRPAHVAGVGQQEGERARRPQHLQLAVGVLVVVGEHRVDDVVRDAVGEVLGGLPVHAVPVVDARVAHVRDVAHRVLADEDVVPVELVLDLVGGHDAVVRAVQLELRAAPHVPDEAVLVQVQVARELVVHVEAEVGVVVVHVPADDAQGCESRAHPVQRHALPCTVRGAREPRAVQVPHDAVLDDVVVHSDEVDPGALLHLPEPRHVAHRGRRADHDVLLDRVVHLVPVLGIDAHAPHVPQGVLLHGDVVSAVDRDADLVRVDDRVPLEDAVLAVPREVEVHAVAAHVVALAAVLHAGVADVHDTVPGHDGVDALLGGVEIRVVAGDEHIAVQVHDLRGELELLALDLPEAAEVLVRQGLLEVHHDRDVLAHDAAVGEHLVEPEAGPGRLRLPLAAPIHGRVVRLEPNLLALQIPREGHLPPTARVVRDVGGRDGGVAVNAEELVDRGVPEGVEVDQQPRQDAGVLEPELDPLLAAVTVIGAPAPPARPHAAVDGRGRQLAPLRPLRPGRRANEDQGPFARAADAADATDDRLRPARGGQADAVARPPSHPDRVVLQEQLVASGPGRAAEGRPGALQRAAVNLDLSRVEAAQEALPQDVVRAAARREVDGGPLQHRALHGADLKVAPLLDEDVVRLHLEPVGVRVPDQRAQDRQGVDREVRVEQPGLVGGHDAVPPRAVRVVHQRGVRRARAVPPQLREHLAHSLGQDDRRGRGRGRGRGSSSESRGGGRRGCWCRARRRRACGPAGRGGARAGGARRGPRGGGGCGGGCEGGACESGCDG